MAPESQPTRENGSTLVPTPRPKDWSFLTAFVLAAALLPVSNGRCAIPVAAWLAPLFLLVFLRSRKPGVGLAVPGDPETGASENLPTVATPFGNVAFAICYDMDFPGYIRQAGRSHADVLIVPSSDPDGIDPIHTRMAVYRAIENGFALVRQTNRGPSAATDHQGRVLASMDYFTTTDRDMVSHVPTRGSRTIYAQIGDAFAWACLASLALVTARAVRVWTWTSR